ncbi:hypothetical protein HDU76_003833 [Blyttiomyces sp. JEL0837]|nr:hypothetical protein HDU76_003833 [Blyttiomyces sp. JEL0837]
MESNLLSTSINPAVNMPRTHLVGSNASRYFPSPSSSIGSDFESIAPSLSAPNRTKNVRKQGAPHRSISLKDVVNPAKEIITLDFTTCLLSTPQKLLATFGEPPRSKKRKSPTRRSARLKQPKNDDNGALALRQVKTSRVQKTATKTAEIVPIPPPKPTRRSKRVQARVDGSNGNVTMDEVEETVAVAAGSVQGNEKGEEQSVAAGADVVPTDDDVGDGHKLDEKASDDNQSKSKKRAREEDEEEDGYKGVNMKTRAVAHVRRGRGGKKVKVV